MKRMKRMKILHLFTPLHEEDEDSSSLHTSSWRGRRLFISSHLFMKRMKRIFISSHLFMKRMKRMKILHLFTPLHEEDEDSSSSLHTSSWRGWRLFISSHLFMKRMKRMKNLHLFTPLSSEATAVAAGWKFKIFFLFESLSYRKHS